MDKIEKEAYEKRLKEADEQINSLEADILNLKQDIEWLEDDVENLGDEIDNLQAELEEFKKPKNLEDIEFFTNLGNNLADIDKLEILHFLFHNCSFEELQNTKKFFDKH